MACEIAAEQAIDEAFKRSGQDHLADAVTAYMNGYNLANEKHRALYNALTRREIQTQSFWERFKASATRRNNIVHNGGSATKEEAESSNKMARELIAYLRN
jgi:hypothetical protein